MAEAVPDDSASATTGTRGGMLPDLKGGEALSVLVGDLEGDPNFAGFEPPPFHLGFARVLGSVHDILLLE